MNPDSSADAVDVHKPGSVHEVEVVGFRYRNLWYSNKIGERFTVAPSANKDIWALLDQDFKVVAGTNIYRSDTHRVKSLRNQKVNNGIN